jgi:hypothetical protein
MDFFTVDLLLDFGKLKLMQLLVLVISIEKVLWKKLDFHSQSCVRLLSKGFLSKCDLISI